MTAAEQQISGNPAAMENAQARTTVTDQAKVQDIISRMDRAHETPMFHRIVTLVAAGMLMDSIDVYIGSAVASSTLATRWSTVAQNSTFMSAGFLGLLVGSLLAGFVGDLKGRRVAYQINLLLLAASPSSAHSPRTWLCCPCAVWVPAWASALKSSPASPWSTSSHR